MPALFTERLAIRPLVVGDLESVQQVLADADDTTSRAERQPRAPARCESRQLGFATEAGRALLDYAFGRLRLERVVATTSDDNMASIGVMQRLGMRIERNPSPNPPWPQVVGVRFHPDAFVTARP